MEAVREPAPNTRPPRRWVRWIVRIVLAVAVLLLVALLAVVVFTRFSIRRAFPQTEGTIQVPGLDGGVEVIRDGMGVPHIYADSVDDLFLAQGFVHAQDRFYQMDFWRHISYGTLSEMFGADQLDTDRFLRTLGWGGLADAQYAAETPEVRAHLDAYAAGVNAYLADHSPARLSFEYTILELLNHGYDPAPWTGAQSLAWGKVMAWDLGGNMSAEIERAMDLATLPAARVDQLFPPYPGDRNPYIVPDAVDGSASRQAGFDLPPSATDGLASVQRAIERVNGLTGGGSEGIGSNSWAVAGRHTPTGAPMLMNDPHLSIQMPSIWYQVGLHCRVVSDVCPVDVVGFSFAGVPGVIIGHNADIAWGFTNLGPDVQDLVIEKVNPDDRNQYEFRGEWLEMDVRHETIRVAGGDDVDLEIRSTIHGPIISDVYEPLEDLDTTGIDPPDPYAIALRWTALEDVPSIAGPVFGIDTATNFEEFRNAARLFGVPAQNLLYADTAGNIGYQMPGLIPIRSSGDGTVPVPGWTGDHEWTGYVPFDELPMSFNPDSGYIVTANNAVVDDTYPHLITEDWTYGYRARRIVDLVTSNFGIPIERQEAIQFDGYDLNAEFLLPYVTAALDTPLEPVPSKALSALTAWDLQNLADRTGAAVWNATWRHILARTFHDEIAEDYWPEGGSRWFEVVRGIAPDATDPWWDDVTTPEVETRDDILRAAFLDAVTELSGLMGDTVEDWSWGAIHLAEFRNQSLGESGIGVIDSRFNRGPFEASGATSVPNAIGWNAPDGYAVDWLPSMRMLVDLGDLSHSFAVHTTGQSGHTDHEHYDDMIPIWLAGDNLPFLWDRADVLSDAESTLFLVP
jgi:penicillin G amidase